MRLYQVVKFVDGMLQRMTVNHLDSLPICSSLHHAVIKTFRWEDVCLLTDA